jgi:8-amino-7-oxononanoate synthase
MDGDLAPLKEMVDICAEHKANLVVDEAHATGIWGEKGQGLIFDLGLTQNVFAVIHTYGKAMGIHGASISGSHLLKDFLINFARPFIYTTAPSDHEVISIRSAFEFLHTQPNRQVNLFHKIQYFNQLAGQSDESAIKTIKIGGNKKTKEVAISLQENGFDVRPILSPTVKEGTERIRICLHNFNSEEEIASLAEHISKLNFDLSF